MERLLRRAVRLTTRWLRGDSGYEVCLTLTDDREIRALNQAFRGVDRPTDVLSFAVGEEMPGAPPIRSGWTADRVATGDLLLGDIVISLERVLAQARAYGHSPRRELVFLTVHGTLHLLGLDHTAPAAAAQMEAAQRGIMAALRLPRPEAADDDRKGRKHE
jgi:probable rRNA maturation factor